MPSNSSQQSISQHKTALFAFLAGQPVDKTFTLVMPTQASAIQLAEQLKHNNSIQIKIEVTTAIDLALAIGKNSKNKPTFNIATPSERAFLIADILDLPHLPDKLAKSLDRYRLGFNDKKQSTNYLQDLSVRYEQALLKASLLDEAMAFSLAEEALKDKKEKSYPTNESLWIWTTSQLTSPKELAFLQSLMTCYPEVHTSEELFAKKASEQNDSSSPKRYSFARKNTQPLEESLATLLLEQAHKGIAFSRMAMACGNNESLRLAIERQCIDAQIPLHSPAQTAQVSIEGLALLAMLRFKQSNFSREALCDYLSLDPLPGLDPSWENTFLDKEWIEGAQIWENAKLADLMRLSCQLWHVWTDFKPN
ncbi:MAG: hypothetical protein IPJ88_07705 [Myxococcales bacterium]|nr:MAG: hypothetical protein IPJ88_07705 [Myxococcales bacterium]